MKILLADDHTLFRDTLVEYMKRSESANEIVIAEDYYQADEMLNNLDDIDLVLLDYKMPGMNGLEGLSKLKNNHPETPVALLSGVAEEHHVKEAMKMGAIGFFPKTLSGKALMRAIDLVMAGEKFLPLNKDTNELQPSYYNGYEVDPKNGGKNGHKGEDKFAKLTKREKEVLSFLVKGASNKEIARALDLQIVTIKLHVRGICKKLDAKNRTQAALIAQRKGLVEV